MPVSAAGGAANTTRGGIAGGVVNSDFVPAWWLTDSHLQTLWPALCRLPPNVSLDRERIELADGDFVDLDWNRGGTQRIALILHGLEGGSRSRYARGMLAALERRGWRAGALHFRGCSGSLNRLARNYHSGDTADLDFVVARIRRRWPCAPLAIIGYSLGGNVLLKWLAEQKDTAPVAAAVAVSVPFSLAEVATRLERGASRIYQWRLVSSLKRKMRRKLKARPLPLSLDDVETSTTFWEFDDRVTAPLHGFADAATYYRDASCGPVLRDIVRPTLIIHALDDPFMVESVVPPANALSPRVRLELSRKGGHVGFIGGGVPGRPRYWLEERIPRFLDDVTKT
jgi:predicted alpha/beta-fold hydrolase